MYVLVIVSALSRQAGADEQTNRLPCHLTPGPMHMVISVEDARTVVLEDGSSLRLSGLLPPFTPISKMASKGAARRWPPEMNAIAALEKLTVGNAITVADVNPKRDRYGVLQAHIFVRTDDLGEGATPRGASKTLVWVQEHLLKNGRAQAYEPFGQSDCFEMLLSFEHEAQRNNLGIWAHPAFRAIRAGKTARLLKRRGSYVRVQGKVISVARRLTRTYLNFGNNWRTDFTITVPRFVIRAHPAWAKDLQDMTSKTVEVEGFLTARNGPMIALEAPDQLRVLEQGGGARKASFRGP